MSADRNDRGERGDRGDRADNSRFGGRTRGTVGNSAKRDEAQAGLRDAIAFLNRDSVALPAPEAPPWAQQARVDPPLAPVRELRPGHHDPDSPVAAAMPMMENGPQFPVQHREQPPPPSAWPMQRPPGQHAGQHSGPPAGPLPGLHPGSHPGQSRHELDRRVDAVGINAFANVDWVAVDLLRKQVRDRVTEQFPHRDAGTEEQRRAFGMAVIEEAVNSWYARSLSRGLALSDTEQHTMRRAVGASVFGMGRLTPLLEHSDIENIEYRGCDDGYVVYSDGRVERGPAIADSDEGMLSDLQYWAAKQNRTLSASTPHLYLTLEGGARLTATIGTSKRPNLVIRRHRVVDVTLDDLVSRGMVSQAIAAFLRSAVLANCNIVVTGPLNSGKTTLLRALAAEIPPMERYATLETEYELHLDEVGRHPRMVAYQALVGTAEQGHNGRRAGEVTLTDIMEVALRMNFTRLIVGEIRGAEVVAMLEAVSTGGRGSLCTMHANSARDVFGRFVTLCTRTNMTRDSAVQLAAESLHYIVNVQMDSDSATGVQNTRTARRYVDQIVEVNGMGDGTSPSATDVFAAGPDGRGLFSHRPERLAKLQKAGFDPNWLLFGNDHWSVDGGAAAARVSRPAPAQHADHTVQQPFQTMPQHVPQNTAQPGQPLPPPMFHPMPTATGPTATSVPIPNPANPAQSQAGQAQQRQQPQHSQAQPQPQPQGPAQSQPQAPPQPPVMSEQERFDRQYLEDRQRLDRYSEPGDYDESGNFRPDYNSRGWGKRGAERRGGDPDPRGGRRGFR